MSDSEFQKLTRERDAFPGPKTFFVSGYDAAELETLCSFLNSLGYEGVPVKPCSKAQLDDPLETALSADTVGEPLGSDKLPRIMVFSGLTVQDVQTVMARFSVSGLQRPIFATTTPTNLTFSVKTLLIHLLEEQKTAR
jgi:hypothetical protein